MSLSGEDVCLKNRGTFEVDVARRGLDFGGEPYAKSDKLNSTYV